MTAEAHEPQRAMSKNEIDELFNGGQFPDPGAGASADTEAAAIGEPDEGEPPIGLAGAASSIGVAVLVHDPFVCGLLMVWGLIMWGMGTPVYYAIMQRIIPAPIMATGIGIDNGLANFGSAMAPAVIGFLIGATGSYLAGLLFIAVLGLIGAAGAGVLAMEKY